MGAPVGTQYRNYDSSDTTKYAIEPGLNIQSIEELGWSAPSGKIFVEWNTQRDGNGTSYSNGDPDPLTEIYAIWVEFVDYATNTVELTSIANAIRAKGGTSASLTYPDDFVSAIQAIQTGTDISDTTATASDVLSGKYFYVANGTKTQGSIATKTASNLSASGKTVTVPAGYYASQYTKDVATGTEGTPTATKGTVSSNSITVTPSVTNTAGYISGGTKTGTAVTVSASELVSGTKAISASGTTDVTNYANASVSAGSATTPATTITAQPTISVSSSGLITATNNETQSVTPTVSAGYVSSGTAGTITVSGSATEQLSTQGTTTYHPSTTDQTIASTVYLTGQQTIKAVTTTNLTAGNIKKDVVVKIGDSTDDDCVTSITGTYEEGGRVTQDDSTLYLSNTGSIVAEVPLSVTENGTYTPSAGYAYSSVEVDVSGGGGTTKTVTITLGYPSSPSSFSSFTIYEMTNGVVGSQVGSIASATGSTTVTLSATATGITCQLRGSYVSPPDINNIHCSLNAGANSIQDGSNAYINFAVSGDATIGIDFINWDD